MVLEKEQTPIIKLGDYLILQRQKYTKMCKFSNLDTIVVLGREKLELNNLLGQPYGATYKMLPKDTIKTGEITGKKKHDKKQRLLTLEICNEAELRDLRTAIGVDTSGKDNRNILDDGESQTLTTEDIEQLRDTYNDSSKIIGKIVQNSKTFTCKTEYSQEKYLKKKEKKYFEFVQIHRPTVRLITDINYRLDAEKIMNLRSDILSQILSYANISAYGNFLLYESGTQGLLPASILNMFSTKAPANLVHMYPGNTPQRQAIYALNLTDECLAKCVSVNIYSALRAFYQNNYETNGTNNGEQDKIDCTESTNLDEAQEPIKKKLKRDELTMEVKDSTTNTKAKWQLENERACKLMHEKFDSLVIAAREHPLNIVRELLKFVKPSSPVLIYSQFKEVLVELYTELKTNAKITNLHIISNWMRMYQILPNRTHPEINMNNSNSFLLYGYTVTE